MKIIDFFCGLFRKKAFRYVIYTDRSSERIPNRNTIVLVNKNGVNLWAKFQCPCGCKEQIILSLSNQIKPSWNVSVNNVKGKTKVTLSPSVYLTGRKCQSHFYIRNNKVIWV